MSLILANSIFADELKVVTTYQYIASIVEQIGKDKVIVSALARGEWDPHTIIPKPSFIAKLRKADLLLISGAQLEIGWLPPLLRQANNPKIQVGTKGIIDLSKHVNLIDVPTSISRAQGDIHPDGNPHFYLDLENILLLSEVIAQKLSELDLQNRSFYENNYLLFKERWNNKINEWNEKLNHIKGSKVIEYHKLYDYLIRSSGVHLVGTIEPLPGIPPSSKHIDELEKILSVTDVKFILQDVYNPHDAAEYLSKKYKVKLIILPHDVGAVKEAIDIFSLFDEIVKRLSND